MTLSQIITELTDLQKHIGPSAEVRVWYLAREAATTLDVLKTCGVTAGWDKHTQKPTAVISAKP